MIKINWRFWQKKQEEIPNLAGTENDKIDTKSESTGVSGFYQFPGAETGNKWYLRFFNKSLLVKIGIPLGVLLFLIIFFLVLPGLSIYSSVKTMDTSSRQLLNAVREQNIGKIRKALAATKRDALDLEKGINRLSWIRFTPFLGSYWNDANHGIRGGIAGIEAAELAVNALEPYADILGFKGMSTGPTKSADDRIKFLLTTLSQLIPKIDPITEKTHEMAIEFEQIDPDRYPEHLAGRKLRDDIRAALRVVEQINELVTNGKPLLKELPYLAGVTGERTYLLLFQNDKELRPTGGFLTAYSIVKVKNGVLTPSVSTDIYNLDKRFGSKIPAPRIIAKYLPLVPYWYLRDMNLSPDFKVSMDTFSENYGKVDNLEQLDGIIAIDTYPVVWLLKVTGPIGVPGYGKFSAEPDPRCNCPNVVYALESYADTIYPVVWDPNTDKIIYKPPNYDNRKDIIGPLMRSIMANALGQPKEKMPELFDAFWRSLTEKHVLFYMFDPKVQKAMESFNLAGRVRDYDGDYLYINDANFAGAKSNQYIQEEVTLNITPSTDGTINLLSIKYKNPQSADGWLNGYFRDVLRIYVPKGSKLLDSTGSDEEVKTYDELGKTVFESFFVLRPEGVTELTFRYKTPVKTTNGGYRILIQKQPGTFGHRYKVSINENSQEFELRTDKELHF